MSRLRDEGPALAVLASMLLAGLALRVLHNDHGLPYVYYVDEGSHFTKRAVEVFRDPNPGYFQNPSAYTYLLHAAYRIASVPAGGAEAVIDAYTSNAAWVFRLSRTVAALLSLAGVVAVYWAGRVLWDRRTGLIAAAVLCFAFLPVAFSRMALTDTGTLAPVAVALVLAIRLAGGASWRVAAWAGVACGLAIGFKYTAGLVLLAPALALALRRDVRGAAALAAGTVAAFAVTNPFFFLDLDTALHQLRGQAELAGNQGKFGQEDETGAVYYLGSLLWGLGYAAAAAAAVGAVLLARRDRMRAALLLVFPVALFVYLSLQSRFFGRWLLPVYPALALLAGYAVARAAEALRARAPRWELPGLAAALVALLWQPLAADARSMAVLERADTRALARAWLADAHRPELRAVIEPAVPARWFWPVRGGRPVKAEREEFVNAFVRDTQEAHVEYGRTLAPRLLDAYRRRGYCTVVTMGLIRGRAAAAGGDAAAYYERLERESEVVYAVSPFRDGEQAPPFSFDLSYSYYPSAYARPGTEVRVHRLDDCDQGYG